MINVETTVAQNIAGQLGCLAVMGKWPERPPSGTLRGVDFYSTKALVRALAVGAQLFKNKHGYLPNLASPETFSEHIFLRKFFSPLPMPSLADKLAAYDYVKAHVGEDFLPSVVWIGDSFSELLACKPRAGRFVLKANHGWRFNMFLDLPGDLLAKQREIKKQATRWLVSRFGYESGEWQYCTFKPRLFLERFIDFNQGGTPDDFKFYCFGGKACLIEIGVDRFTRLGTAFYDPSWKHFPVGFLYEPIQYGRPDNLDEMIRVAETIAKDMEFARIDLYSDCKRNIKFGEITFTPGNATSRFTQACSGDDLVATGGSRPADFEFDKWLGSFFGKVQSTDLALEDRATLRYHMWRATIAPLANTVLTTE